MMRSAISWESLASSCKESDAVSVLGGWECRIIRVGMECHRFMLVTCVQVRNKDTTRVMKHPVTIIINNSNNNNNNKKWPCYTPWMRCGWEVVQLLLFLNLVARRGWAVSITPRPRFAPGERAPGTHCAGRWVGPRPGLDAEGRGQILCLCRGSNPGRPVRSQTLYWLSCPAHRFLWGTD
jgi:hypothetical protein